MDLADFASGAYELLPDEGDPKREPVEAYKRTKQERKRQPHPASQSTIWGYFMLRRSTQHAASACINFSSFSSTSYSLPESHQSSKK